ncbi:MAG: hypothetical protein RL181_224 [Bacteroidota bacterium]
MGLTDNRDPKSRVVLIRFYGFASFFDHFFKTIGSWELEKRFLWASSYSQPTPLLL